MFSMINRLDDTFRTELEPDDVNRRQHRAVGATAGDLRADACRLCGAGSPSR